MFPYPSEQDTSDCWDAAQASIPLQAAQGFNVLNLWGMMPGLPAEQYAIQTGQHPRSATKETLPVCRNSWTRKIGYSFDWDRQVWTFDHVYHWTR